MGRFQTRDEIQALIVSQYDLPTLSTSTNPTASAVVSYINESLQQMYAMLMECYGDDYFGQSYTLTTTASVPTSSLPPDFHKLISIAWRRDANTSYPVHMASASEAHRSTLAAQDWERARPKYRMTSAALQWCPVPSGAYVVDLWYVAIPADLAAGTDVVSVGPGWVQWVVHDVCTKIATRLRDGESRSFFAQLRDDAEKRLREQAPARSETEAHGVRSVMSWDRGYDGFVSIGERDALPAPSVDLSLYLLANGGNPQVSSVVYAEQTATASVNWAAGARQKITLGANTTFTFVAPSAGVSLQLKLTQDGTGSRTATWPASVRWAGGTSTLTTTAGATDIATFVFDGTTYWGVLSRDFT